MIDVIIVNWNAGHQLRACVDSIAIHGDHAVRQTIVVDNGSADGSDKSVGGMPKVTLIRAGDNLGFGRACNLGARQARAEYLLFLNPDAAVLAGTLAKALAYMQDPANALVGICGVQLLDEKGCIARSCARFPTAARLFARALGIDRFFPGTGSAMTEWDHTEDRQVDQVMGSFFLVRKKVYESLHGFDERFFVYYEEVDFSYRACQAGWRSMYLADAQAFHAGGGTSRQVKARRLFYSLRSRLLYAFKHFSRAGAAGVLLATLLVEPLTRSVLALLQGSVAGLKETWGAYGMLWRWLREWMFKRSKR